jgi:Uma2 family endonuclease
MADPAIRSMSLDEFLRWDDETGTRYELIGGFPMAMAPPSEAHGVLAARLAARLESALAARRPCRAVVEAGVVREDRRDMFFVADVGVTCASYDPRRQHMQDPILLIEILSPSTERHDRRVKLPAYQGIGSVQEILLLAADEAYAELHRRHGDLWVIQIIPAGGSLRLDSVGIEVSLVELYEGLALPAEGAG